jgi:hypothetical protein
MFSSSNNNFKTSLLYYIYLLNPLKVSQYLCCYSKCIDCYQKEINKFNICYEIAAI